MIFDTAISVSASGFIPWNSAGYSIAPTPMIAPWPAVSRGTEWLVPIVPGLVRLIVVPGEVLHRELVGAGPPDDVLVAGPEAGEVHLLGALDRGDDERARAVGLGQVDGQAEVDVLGLDQHRLAVDLGVGAVHVREVVERPDQRVADQVGEGDLPAPGTGQVVVDDDAVVGQQLRRHRAHARRRRHGERDVHVLDHGGGRAAQRRLLAGGDRAAAWPRASRPASRPACRRPSPRRPGRCGRVARRGPSRPASRRSRSPGRAVRRGAARLRGRLRAAVARGSGLLAVPAADRAARPVVGEELVPRLVHGGGVGEVLLVHLLDQPLVGSETRHGGGRVGGGPG